MKQAVEQVARVCHEANREYCRTIGDNSQPYWNEAPEWQRSSAIKGVEFHIAHLSSGEKPSPSASHESWLAQKRAEGWKYGPTKDLEKKEHPCFMPYGGLPIEQRMKDYIFAAICEAFWNGRTKEVPRSLMKYIANPVEVDAFEIAHVSQIKRGNTETVTEYELLLNGKTDTVVATAEMTSRMIPKPGDYWVVQSDGYVYLNPKEVFLRKYRPLEGPAAQAAS